MEWSEKVTAALEGLLSFAPGKGIGGPAGPGVLPEFALDVMGMDAPADVPLSETQIPKQPLRCCAVYATLPWKKA